MMKKALKNSMLAVITIGLMSGSVLAHEENYKGMREPHEDGTFKPDVEGGGGGTPDLAAAATNPIANLVQFQIQNAYTSDSYNASGDSNALILQPVVPFKLPSEAVPLFVTRTTLPYINTPDFGGGVGTQEGFGDLVTLGFLLPKLETKGVMVGLGYNLTVPTAGSNDFTGSGKWSIGPGAVYFNMQTPSWQWGILSYSSFSFASQNTDRHHVSSISLQPILVKHFDEGWYAGLADLPQTYDFRTEEWTLAVGPRVGKVTKFGHQPVNLFAQVTYNSNDDTDEIAPEWIYKVNITFLFPK